MRFACGECHRARFGCDLELPLCCDCLERGFGSTPLGEQVHTGPTLSLESSKDGLQRPAIVTHSWFSLFNISRCIVRLQEYLDRKLWVVLSVLQRMCLPVLLCLPVYYLSQASDLLAHVEACKDDYEQWVDTVGSLLDVELSLVETTANIGSIDNAGIRANDSNITLHSIDYLSEPTMARNPPSYTYTTLTGPSFPLSPPKFIIKLQRLWSNYLDSRIIEWRILTTTACVFVAASPTIFQIPEASDDPITRSIAFLALCRALAGIIYGPIFLIYFRRSYARSFHYAIVFCQYARDREINMQWSLWIMLSLQAAATCWAGVFYLFAIFSFIWRTGSTADPSSMSTSNPGYHPMVVPLAIAVRVLITAITVADFGCMIWIWRTLRNHCLMIKSVKNC